MDVNCGVIVEGGADVYETGRWIFWRILDTASGKKTKSEALGFGGQPVRSLAPRGDSVRVLRGQGLLLKALSRKKSHRPTP